MYSYEMKDFLEQRNYQLTPQECLSIINPYANTQISSIKHYSSDNQYIVDTDDGYHFRFWVEKYNQ